MNKIFNLNDAIKKKILEICPNVEITSYANKVSAFASWYEGFVADFHRYKSYTGTDWIELERKSLNMAKYICESWASLLLNEKCDVVIDKKEELDKVLKQCKFWIRANKGIEKSFALGFGAFVVGVNNVEIGEITGAIKTDNARVQFNFVDATRVIPLVVDDGEVIECAFYSKNDDYLNLVIHTRDESGNYVIHNVKFDCKTWNVIEEYSFPLEVNIPMFQIIKPNIADNGIFGMGDFEFISVFANAIDVLKAIDTKYDAFDLEYVLGKKRMFVGEQATTYVKDKGTFQKAFNPNDVFFYSVPNDSDEQILLKAYDSDLRYEAYIRGINAEMNYLSMKCGLGDNYFKFDGSSIATATQVISENSTLFRNIKKQEILLEDVLINITRAIMFLSNKFTKIKFPNWETDEINIIFDDSIIEDKGAEMKRDQELVSAGLMGRVEYRMKWFGETEDVANENVLKYLLPETIAKYMPIMASGLITPEMFVDMVYPNVEDKEALIEYIKENIQKAPLEDMDFIYQGDESGSDDVDES